MAQILEHVETTEGDNSVQFEMFLVAFDLTHRQSFRDVRTQDFWCPTSPRNSIGAAWQATTSCYVRNGRHGSVTSVRHLERCVGASYRTRPC